jgi:hypothetical protein
MTVLFIKVCSSEVPESFNIFFPAKLNVIKTMIWYAACKPSQLVSTGTKLLWSKAEMCHVSRMSLLLLKTKAESKLELQAGKKRYYLAKDIPPHHIADQWLTARVQTSPFE